MSPSRGRQDRQDHHAHIYPIFMISPTCLQRYGEIDIHGLNDLLINQPLLRI